MAGRIMLAALAAGLAAPALAQGGARNGVPAVVEQRVSAMVTACARAGGKLGAMTGQGQFVIPRDFTGDGRVDYLVSEGNFPCTGQPNLFRPGGRSLVQLYVADGQGGAALGFSDRLIGYRVLDGRPARLQIARAGAACGGGARGGDELRWDAARGGFALVPTDGRPGGAVPATAPAAVPAVQPVSAPRGQTGPAAAAAGGAQGTPAGPAAIALNPGPQARQAFDARCRVETKARYPTMNAAAIAGACADGWTKVEAAGPVADALLAAVPARAGETVTLGVLQKRLPQIRWTATRPAHRFAPDAAGRWGALEASVTGAPVARSLSIGWSRIEADPPYDVAGALAARGAQVRPLGCYHFGSSEVNRVYLIDAPGRPAFALETYTRTAAIGGQESRQVMTVDLTGRLPTLASLRAAHKDPAWNANCPY